MTAGRRFAAALTTVLLSCVAVMLVHSATAPAASGVVVVFPIPGSQTAMPQTQISFRGIQPKEIGDVEVTGSLSGTHSGKLLAHSDKRGASFVPDQPFTPGETVTVSTSLSLLGAGPGSGAGPGYGAGPGVGNTYSFTIATPVPVLSPLHWPAAPRSPGDVGHFRSRPDLLPVNVAVTHPGANGSGDIFLAPQWGPLQDGPMILDPNGKLVWFQPLSGNDSASDFRTQRYRGNPVLTWWQGYMHAGTGFGEDVIMDDSYRQIATVQAGNGVSADLHEFEITRRNTALIIAGGLVYWDASAVHDARHHVGSTHQIVLDSIVQEIDIPTGLVLFQWSALDHIPLTDTYELLPGTLGQPFDPYHLNSVDIDGDGNLIISSRNTWAGYKVDRTTGAVIWILGGRHSSFKLAHGTHWAFQHDVRIRAANDGLMTIFDDEAGPPRMAKESRALEISLNLTSMVAKQIFSLAHSPSLLSAFEGNYQVLPNGDAFIGWGQQPYLTEYGKRGRVVFDARMVDANSSYRGYRFPWSAVPAEPPAVSAVSKASSTVVYVSWNGATSVASWRLLGGASTASMQVLATVPKQSFETAIKVSKQACVQVQALDATGAVIGSSIPRSVH